VDEVAKSLLLYETVTGEEVARILAGATAVGLRPPPDAEEKGASWKSASERRGGEDRSKEKGLSGNPGLSPA
jgi:hypothetical protein